MGGKAPSGSRERKKFQGRRTHPQGGKGRSERDFLGGKGAGMERGTRKTNVFSESSEIKTQRPPPKQIGKSENNKGKGGGKEGDFSQSEDRKEWA